MIPVYIENCIRETLQAVYGRDVRKAIHDALEYACGKIDPTTVEEFLIGFDVYSLSDDTILPSSYYTYDNTIIKGDGTDTQTMNGWHTTPYIPIMSRSTVFTGGFFIHSAYNSFVLYDKDYAVVAMFHGNSSVKMTDYPTARYFRASEHSNGDHIDAHVEISKYPYFYVLNRLYTSDDPVTLPEEYYIHQGLLSQDGTEITFPSSGWTTTDYLSVFNSDVCFSGGFFPAGAYRSFALYDKEYNVIMTQLGDGMVNISDYPEAAYFRTSKDSGNGYMVEICKSSARESRVVHVGAGQRYTRLRDGIDAAVRSSGTHVIVHPGTYNLAQEFSSEISAQSARGIHLSNDVYVEFMAGSYVKALFPSSNDYISTYFQPFYGRNFTLDGLNIEASNCRYCVHDEQASDPEPYHNVYKNCVMKMTAQLSSGITTAYSQCIGGGMGMNGFIEIIGGFFTTVGDSSAGTSWPAISYHNGGTSGCDGKIFIRDVYLDNNNYIGFGHHGNHPKKTKCYVSGCNVYDEIDVHYESNGANENMEVVEWNNIVRNAPVVPGGKSMVMNVDGDEVQFTWGDT